ncbi:hypothetical protein TBLA_0I03350 [Henningerozyma blattae CBS 6284]|uniref:Pyrimidine 5'-nucleotidase n=1 Tax=Henningerozyma blattae (strain ATCC 34711 / CBS 6284 / DSM 70876 / NBRC 10599 / NRRL Y-10934 / UCD 77-7) TaxID=1071380 RepID=I2H9D8_HENB6|nr:hypothetical protein TBLA_0I03350 [Tetrapisispora blattae CBS 6284]CCH62990.1 hypothetical protein TBLA_0I03350 [Tetrapisispora blattae CBS 6284]
MTTLQFTKQIPVSKLRQFTYPIDSNDAKLTYRQKIEGQLKLNTAHLDSLDYPGSKVTFDINQSLIAKQDPNNRIFYFDIDNCLYKKSTHIQDYMQLAIINYLIHEVGLNEKHAMEINSSYYKKYGLVIKGLVQLHHVDALEYNRMVDDSLPLQDLLTQDIKLRNFLMQLRSTCKFNKFWLFTNAYKTHALRVIRILGIADLFDGITYCDYSKDDASQFIAKPDPRFFEKAKLQSGLTDWNHAWFADDSWINLNEALRLGINHVVNVNELTTTPPLINTLVQLNDTLDDQKDVLVDTITVDSSMSLSSMPYSDESTTTVEDVQESHELPENAFVVNDLTQLKEVVPELFN